MKYLITLLFACFASHAIANPCEAVAVHTVQALEDKNSVLRAGSNVLNVTFMRVSNTNVAYYCGQGDYCYPIFVNIGDKAVIAQKLLHCNVTPYPIYRDEQYRYYGTVPIEHRMSAPLWNQTAVENKFLELGVCGRCARDLSYFYEQRGSKCGRLVHRALYGNRKALHVVLNNFPDFCVR